LKNETAREQRNQALDYAALPAAYSAGSASTAAWVLVLIAVVMLAIGVVDVSWMGLTISCAVAAAIAGTIRLKDASRSHFVGKGRAWVGIIGGGVVVALAVLMMIGEPARQERRARGKCKSNLRQVGQGLQMYANANNGSYPASFAVLLGQIDLNSEVFVCPASNDEKARGETTEQTVAEFVKPGHCSYVYVGAGASASMPADFVVAYEPLEVHGGRGAHFLTRDGEVKWCDAQEAQNLIRQLKAGTNPPK
jgi:hypothetical protein